MANDLDQQLEALARRADRIRKELLTFASRAFVIEFVGTPKSGKSTSVEAVRHFFSRHDFRVHVLVERASVCPIPMKGHLFFNTWCAATMLAELLANVDTETDIIIVDRGLLDALVWLTLQRQRGELTEQEAKTIEAFLLLDRWRSLIDMAVVMNVAAEKAIEREHGQRITSKPGSIMNVDVLRALSASVDDAVTSYGSTFGTVIKNDTSAQSVRESVAGVTGRILDQFETFLNPEIFVVPRKELEKLARVDGGAFSEDAKGKLLACIASHGAYMHRAEAEGHPEFVQIIACGILTHGKEVFLFERKERDPKYQLYGKTTIWQGTHVEQRRGEQGLDLLKSALIDKITRSLFLSRSFPLEFIGYCWDPEDDKSSRHFGVMFKVDIDNDHTATDLRKKEFRKGRGHALAGRFVDWNAFESNESQKSLESWSISVLRNRGAIKGLGQGA